MEIPPVSVIYIDAPLAHWNVAMNGHPGFLQNANQQPLLPTVLNLWPPKKLHINLFHLVAQEGLNRFEVACDRNVADSRKGAPK